MARGFPSYADADVRSSITCCLALFLLALLSPVSASADAVVPETSFRFGRVLSGHVLTHEFVLTNDGSAPLRISKVQLTPPLVVTSMPALVLPGAKAAIRVSMDTAGLRGRFVGEIQIFLNDGTSADVNLSVDGEIVPLVEVSPAPVFFLGARRGETRQASVEIINHEPEPLRIEDIRHAQDRFATTLETLEEGRRYRLTLLLKPDGPGGRHSDPIVLRTSSRSAPSITVVANTLLRERVYSFPDEVDFGTLSLSSIERDPELLKAVAQTLMVYQFGGADFTVRVRTAPPQLAITSERGSQGDRYQNTVSLIRERLQVGALRGSLVFETNDSQFQELVVPVVGTIVP